MKLNIHIISHPIIEILSNLSKNQAKATTIKNHALRYLGLFMIYETVRSWLKIYRLTVTQALLQKEISVIDPKESYVIIFNNLNELSLFNEVQELIPNNSLNLIEKSEIDKKNEAAIKLPKISSCTKIIITLKQLDSKYVLSLLEYLAKKHNTKLAQIRLICIICTTDQLIDISERYGNLNIYTTKIKQNQK